MQKEIEQLLILQDRDRKVRALKAELKMVPTERKALEDQVTKSAARQDAEKQKGREIEIERKKLENEAQAKRDQIARYNQQKLQTRKNEEYQALTNEIRRCESEIQAVEDRELELMESAEKQKAAIAEADRELAENKALHGRQCQHLEEKSRAIEQQLLELEGLRAQSAAGLEEDLLDTYNRLFSSKHDSAVVALEHEVCSGCHMKLTPSTVAKTKARKQITHCEQCGRILYSVA
jgi:predicted  nucleic acid-binding Zn-ribbon protein